MTFGPSDRYYDPPEPPGPCCRLGEDDDDHDVQACLDEQAEAAAEEKAERMREAEKDWEYDVDVSTCQTCGSYLDVIVHKVCPYDGGYIG